jgi:putative hydrolase of the HAD superfamily
MRHLLASSEAPAARLDELVDWLWAEQPARNLWRRPIAGVVEIVRELHAARVPLAIVSNSEGRLAELAADLGWLDLFGEVADSGRLGIEKPDPRIFAWTAERIAVSPEAIVHVGDAWAADVEGALAAGMWAVWFGPLAAEARELPPRVFACTDASSLRTVLTDLGLPIARG